MFRDNSLLSYLFWGLFFLFLFPNLFAQETNSRASARVLSEINEPLAGTTVLITHEPTQTKYMSLTDTRISNNE